MNNVRIITTEDGSHSLIDTTLNETYHSQHGALRESTHVYIDSGLDYFQRTHTPKKIRVLEVGFGSGLNALLAMQWAKLTATPVYYVGIEAFPLPEEIWRKLNYGTCRNAEGDFYHLHELPWGVEHELGADFFFRKEHTSIQDYTAPHLRPQVIFYDAFAPDKQPEMWTPDTLSSVVEMLAPQGVMVTYSAKGQLKRTLKSLGMTVESLPGAPGKKEMTRATRNIPRED